MWFSVNAAVILTFEEIACCWNHVIWVQFYHLGIWCYLLRKAVFTSLSPTFILRWRYINRKTLITQIWIIRPSSKLNIIMFSIAINWHHTLTVFVWVLGVAATSNGYWVIFFLIKVRNVHLSVFRLIDWLGAVVTAFGSGCTQSLFLAYFERIRNYLNWTLFSLIVSSVQLTALVGMGVVCWYLTVV